MAYRRPRAGEYGVSVLMIVILIGMYLYGRSISGSPETEPNVAREPTVTDQVAQTTTNPMPETAIRPAVVPSPAPAKPPVQQVSVQPAEVPRQSLPDLVIDGQAVTAIFDASEMQVLDGDSIRLKDSQRKSFEVRLASIDAPEWKQDGGAESKQHLRDLTNGRTAKFYQVGVDRYGRRLAFMFLAPYSSNGSAVEVNAQMVADGYAWHATQYSNNPQLRSLQENARTARLGIWGQPGPIPPWEYRSRNRH